MPLPIATWILRLNVECPECHNYVDLLDEPDFWDGRDLDPCENMTDRSKGVEVVCPSCESEFLVDLEY